MAHLRPAGDAVAPIDAAAAGWPGPIGATMSHSSTDAPGAGNAKPFVAIEHLWNHMQAQLFNAASQEAARHDTAASQQAKCRAFHALTAVIEHFARLAELNFAFLPGNADSDELAALRCERTEA